MEHNHKVKPRDVLSWLQSPNPWPSCNSNYLGKPMEKIRETNVNLGPLSPPTERASMPSATVSVDCKTLNFCPKVLYDDWEPLVTTAVSSMVLFDEWEPSVVEWDSKIPKDTNTHKWRRIQITRYTEENPMHKPR